MGGVDSRLSSRPIQGRSLSSLDTFELQYRQLLRHIIRGYSEKPPALGEPPVDLFPEPVEPLRGRQEACTPLSTPSIFSLQSFGTLDEAPELTNKDTDSHAVNLTFASRRPVYFKAVGVTLILICSLAIAIATIKGRGLQLSLPSSDPTFINVSPEGEGVRSARGGGSSRRLPENVGGTVVLVLDFLDEASYPRYGYQIRECSAEDLLNRNCTGREVWSSDSFAATHLAVLGLSCRGDLFHDRHSLWRSTVFPASNILIWQLTSLSLRGA